MSALRFLLLMKSAGARYVAGATYGPAGNSQAITMSAYKASDLVMIFVTVVSGTASITGGAGGWTSDVQLWSLGYRTYCFRKTVVAGDLSGVTVSMTAGAPDANIHVVGYRGASTATLKEAKEVSATSLAFAGFTKAIGCRRLVSHLIDRDPTATPTIPTSWFARLGTYVTTFFASRTADVPPSRYTNGAAVTWTTLGASNPKVGMLYELT